MVNAEVDTAAVEDGAVDTGPPTESEPLWGTGEVSTYLGIPVETLYCWRRARYGPKSRRVGKHLRYSPEAVRAWFDAQDEND